jgi:general secretion pathway protein D
MRLRIAGALGLLAVGWVLTGPAWAQPAGGADAGAGATVSDGQVQLDFNDVELSVVIDTIARLTGKNFIYDDRVRGRVTIVSPTKITVEEAYAVFESVLQVKGFTTVQAPGGAIKVIPLREAKESNVETVRGGSAPPTSDRFITRLIPLRYIDAEAIAETLKPLVSKDASLVAYAPTNTIILTDAATNISRILSIVQSIDVETFKEELSVIELQHADAATLAQQLSEIFGAEVGSVGATGVARLPTRARRPTQAGVQPGSAELATKGQVRIITDERTNSLVVLASRPRTAEIRDVVLRLDVPVKGGGRIHVYYLKYADAEELANTISALLSGQPAAPTGGGLSGGIGGQSTALSGGTAGAAQALRSSISELAGGVTVTADPPTNSLLIQASQEGFSTLSQVIAQLDIPRPSVLVEALIMEVDVTDSIDLGFSGLVRITSSGNQYVIGSLTDSVLESEEGDTTGGVLDNLVAALADNPANFIGGAAIETGSTLIQGLIRASATVNGTNILSAPHILTLDNEEAEIKVGDNIPIISSRVQSAAGIETTDDPDTSNSLATSQNIERQDIGITLRVTPQISEGDTLRLEIFQEVTAVNEGLTGITGSAQEVGVALSNRKIENVVTVSDEETVVIGGLIDEIQQDGEDKVPWLGDIPILGWLFKSTSDSIQKRNLLVFLTPHIIRNKSQHAQQTIRKREEFWASSEASSQLSDSEREESERRREEDAAAGIELPDTGDTNPVRSRLRGHRKRYPVEMMRDLEARNAPGSTSAGDPAGATAGAIATAAAPVAAPNERWGVLAATFADEGAAASALQQLIDAGHDGALVSEEHQGTLLYEVRLGPYADQAEAERTAAGVREAFRFAPTVYVEEPAE